MTITEALAEIKTINARIMKKRESLAQYLARDGKARDPLEKEGGSVEFIKRERQAVSDLEKRVVAIRTAIQAKNLVTPVVVNGTTQSLAEWLTWRREVANGTKNFLASLRGVIQSARKQAVQMGRPLKEATGGEAEFNDVVININEVELAKETEEIETTLGELDGKLSLLNATTHIEV